jgi:hypothetical protein
MNRRQRLAHRQTARLEIASRVTPGPPAEERAHFFRRIWPSSVTFRSFLSIF